MLPEGQLLQAFAAEANVASYDTFGLLARFGRDVAGAAVIAETDPAVRLGGIAPYTPESLSEEVAGLEDRPLGIHDDSELSLAGLQNKLLLVKTSEGWARPTGGRPSTHILKVEDRRFPGLATMEAAALKLASAVELTSVEVQVDSFAGIPCIIVSRFDRRVSDDKVDRIHQEDACQALGIDPGGAEGKAKYEAQGGPSFRDVAGLLDRYSAHPLDQLLQLVAVATFTVCIDNADAHGKNVGFIYREPGVIGLAPLYDTVPTALWPRLRTRAAMTINHRVNLTDVTLADLGAEAVAWRLSRGSAIEMAVSIAEKLLAAVESEGIPDELAMHVRERSRNLLKSRVTDP